jgi:hypothetical protein
MRPECRPLSFGPHARQGETMRKKTTVDWVCSSSGRRLPVETARVVVGEQWAGSDTACGCASAVREQVGGHVGDCLTRSCGLGSEESVHQKGRTRVVYERYAAVAEMEEHGRHAACACSCSSLECVRLTRASRDRQGKALAMGMRARSSGAC